MEKVKIILTGATGMVGEGVLFECLQNEKVEKILMVNRRHYDLQHAKLEEMLVPDFMKIGDYAERLKGWDACFYCAGISSVGMKEDEYEKITYDTTMRFAEALSAVNPQMIFNFVSGNQTDGSEKGKIMWARIKGKTENALMKLPFRGEYNFRPGFMKPFDGQKNVKFYFKPLNFIFPVILPKLSLTLQEVGRAMINAVIEGYPKQVLEIADIKDLAKI